MEKDYIHCTIFVTFVLVVLFIIIKLFMTMPKLPFHIERSLKMNVDNNVKPIENISFNGIPSIIYQSYNDDTVVSSELINNISDNVSINEEFEFYLFNMHDKRLFIQSNFNDELIYVFDSLPLNEQHKLWIYCILYKNGGVYMDINFKLKKSLLDIITPIMANLQQNNNIIFTKNINMISNKLIISPPGLSIYKELIDSYINNKIITLSNLIDKYDYNDNVKLCFDKNSIKYIDTNEIIIYVN